MSYSEHITKLRQLVQSKNGAWDGIHAESVARALAAPGLFARMVDEPQPCPRSRLRFGRRKPTPALAYLNFCGPVIWHAFP